MIQKIVPNLWFDDQALAAANFYTSVFKSSKIVNVMHYGKASSEVSGKVEGSVMAVEFEIEGQRFVALNGGSEFKFNESISFIVNCENQEEIDMYWRSLTEGGQESVCGWLKDKFGVSWQIVPTVIDELLSDPDPERAERVMRKFLEMKKIDINSLIDA
ncbi:MAG: VOC family protein [Candidatus Shapirobacteria bacterium]|jgi:predicted 3-demethylubiquinone-9 3-methyltransferase (glyoxalase superfamily)